MGRSDMTLQSACGIPPMEDVRHDPHATATSSPQTEAQLQVDGGAVSCDGPRSTPSRDLGREDLPLQSRSAGMVVALHTFHAASFVGHARGMSLQELTWILGALAVAGALLAWRTAPAVAVALLSGLVGAIAAGRVSWTDGPEGIPGEVAFWFSLGLWVGATLGRDLPARGAWHAADGPLGRGPAAHRPARVCGAHPFPARRVPALREGGICDYMGTDVLGGWITGVVFIFAIDLLVLSVLLGFAPGPSRGRRMESEAARSRPASAGRIAMVCAWIGLAVAILVVAFTRPTELEAWRASQPDAESFAANLLAPAPLGDPVFGCPSVESDGGHLPRGGLDPERGQWLDGHAPRWLPEDFGLVDWLVAEDGWDPGVGDAIYSQSVGVWADGGCRRVSLALFWGDPHAPRLDRLYSVVDEVGGWNVVAGPRCKRAATADGSCLHYLAWSHDERGEGRGRVLGLRLQMLGIDRDVGDRIALGIPV